MSKANIEVKWFHSEMPDAPVLRGQAGALIELLDACLINGFSTRTPDSITVASGVATVAISAGNPYERHAVIKISGASVAALNDEWRIAAATANSLTFVCPGVPDGVVTGASLIRAGAGWAKPFSDTNLAAYQSADPASTQLYLRVNDVDARYTRVRGYEQMTDINTGTGLFPLIATLAETALTWPKSDTASAAARTWAVIADRAFVWVLLHSSSSVLAGKLPHHFGDIKTYLPNDAYHCTISGVAHATTDTGGNHPGTGSTTSSSAPRVYARAHSQTGGPVVSFLIVFASTSTNWTGSAAVPAASTLDGNIRLGKIFSMTQNTTSQLRGELPGAMASIERLGFTDLTVVDAADGAFLAVSCANGQTNNTSAVALFDIVGPWR